MKNRKTNDSLSRRDFLRNAAFGAGATLLLTNFSLVSWRVDEKGILRGIVVDYDLCTGCRTCETACSSSNHKVKVEGELMNGLGNPWLANIRVHRFNPDVDIPNVCQMCPDAPCVTACPVEPDPETGRRALYRDDEYQTIINDLERCIGCGSCALACENERAGVIISNPETGNPERMCTLCSGDPQCVKICPFGALSLVEVDTKREFFGMSPGNIATELMKKFYKLGKKEVSYE
jgi:carbon-monoxide dehydrogenase iron sulfur subunit